MDPLEVAITSDTTGQLWNSSVWDVHSGTSLFSYRGGGVAAPRTLCLLGEDYLVSSERTKPILHFWALNSHEQTHGIRFVLPGRATALAFSPDGCYCVAGIEDKIYVWQTSSGNLLAIASRHYQTITSVKFCDDGSHFVSAADDGIVMVWSLAPLISNAVGDLTSQSVAGQHDPLYIFSDHSLPVSDIYIGKGGIRARLATVSVDRTCKVYDLSCGELVLNLVFDKSLTAVTMDLIEMNVFVGTIDGIIHQFSIVNPPRMREYYLAETDKALVFSGHSNAVTCLSISMDGETMISGSNDEQLIVWHIPSRQKTHGIPHKGAITNAYFTIVPRNMFAKDFTPSFVLHSFQRTVDTDIDLEIVSKERSEFWDDADDKNDNFAVSEMGTNEVEEAKVGKLNTEIHKLKQINSDLYNFAVKKILKNV